MHQCGHVSAALNYQFAVTLRNVFDTQVRGVQRSHVFYWALQIVRNKEVYLKQVLILPHQSTINQSINQLVSQSVDRSIGLSNK